MCQWLSALTTASGLSQEEFPLERAAGQARATGCSLTGQNGSTPAGQEATEDPCHPLPLFALPELCQASSGKTHTHTHLKLGTWKELFNHRMPPHLRPNLGPTQTKKTKHALIQTILLAMLPLERDVGCRRGENQPQSLMCHYKHKNRLLTLPTDVEPAPFLPLQLQ